MSIENEVRDFIATELGWDGSADDLSADYPLLEKEVVDSLGVFKIISFLESKYDIEIDDEELVPENFETIEKISGLVSTKVGT
jgi:acyl carrier protein